MATGDGQASTPSEGKTDVSGASGLFIIELCGSGTIPMAYSPARAFLAGAEPLFSRKGMVVERDRFEQMKDEYYLIRGWDVPTGFQKRDKLEDLNLVEVAEKLASGGLLA